jgi:hypothetical protein
MFTKHYLLQRKSHNKFISISVLAVLLIYGQMSSFAIASEDSTQIELVVMGCNNNAICESSIGENVINCPTDCTPSSSSGSSSGGGGGNGGSTLTSTSGLFSVDTVSIDSSTESVVLSWKTGVPVISTVMWGTTPDYEIGTLSESVLNPSHQVKLEKLLPGKGYYYRIDFKDYFGRTVGQITSSFATKSLPDNTPPVNPKIISSISSSEKVILKWDNPKDIDFQGVRVVRSTYSYPSDPLEGKIIYEGKGNIVTDTNLEKGLQYYYAIFAKDEKGNYSSGAVYFFDNKKDVVGEISSGKIQKEKSVLFELGSEVGNLSVSDLVFSQNGKEVNSYGSAVVVDGNKPITISLRYESLPEILKTIILHVHDSENPDVVSSFLLRANEEKTNYESTIGSFGRFGKSKFSIEVIDFNNNTLHNVEGDFLIQGQVDPISSGRDLIKSLNQAISDASVATKTAMTIIIFIGLYFLIRTFLLL